MDYLERLRAGVEYIEEHLHEDLCPSEVAQAAGISRWHFQRIFKALTKETLKFYIRGRRLSQTLDRLLSPKERILDIALEAGYGSQEAFTRAFKQAFSMTPNQYRQRGCATLFLRKLELSEGYLSHINLGLQLEPEIVEFEQLQLVGLKTHYYGADSEKNNLGEKLPGLWESLLSRMDEVPHKLPQLGYGIIRQVHGDSDCLEYHAAFQVREVGSLPPSMEALCLPPATYARFTHRGFPRQLDHTVNYIYSNWLLRSGWSHSYGPDIEVYGEGYRPNSEDSVIHYAIPIQGQT